MDITKVITSGPSGLDLLVARRRAGLTQQEVADAMGVSRPRVAYLEARYHPPNKAVARYIEALRDLSNRVAA